MSDDELPESLAEAITEIRRLRQRIVELEAAAAMAYGRMGELAVESDFTIEHNVTSNTPR